MISKLQTANVFCTLLTAATLLAGLSSCAKGKQNSVKETEKTSSGKTSKEEKKTSLIAESDPTPKKNETQSNKEKIVREPERKVESVGPKGIERNQTTDGNPRQAIPSTSQKVETKRGVVTEIYDIPVTEKEEPPKKYKIVVSQEAKRWSNHDPSNVGYSGRFTLYVVESKTLGQYEVLISWGQSIHGLEDNVYIERDSQGSSQGNWTGLLSLAGGEHFDRKVVPGETYTYSFTLNSNPKYHQRHTATIKIPKDIVLDGVTRHSELKDYRRVIFNKDAVVVTGGARFEINAEEIISDQGSIQTLASSETAALGVDGLHGGEIKVSAKRANGRLSILAHGQEANTNSEKSVKGGDAAKVTFQIDDSSRLHLRVSSRPGNGAGSLSQGTTHGETRPVCLRLGRKVYGDCPKIGESKGDLE
jgi:hypothetical protein